MCLYGKFLCTELEQPETQAIYIDANGPAEQWSEIVYFLFVKFMFPVFMVGKFVANLIVYFVTDSGNDALDLPFPMS